MIDDSTRTVCAVTGHRPEKLDIPESEIKEILTSAIKQAYDDGFRTVISGMARGIDLWTAQIVLELRDSGYDLELVCAVPYDGFERRWSLSDKTEYDKITSRAEVHFICEHYSRCCFQLRNKWMVDHCSRLIAFWNGQKSGTGNTVKYAKSKEIPIINLLKTEQPTNEASCE